MPKKESKGHERGEPPSEKLKEYGPMAKKGKGKGAGGKGRKGC